MVNSRLHNMSRPYYQRVPYRLLKLFRREVKIQVGRRCLRVPIAPIESLAVSLLATKLEGRGQSGAVMSKRPGAVLEVGANVGTTLLDYLAGGHSPAGYFGFEPNPRCVSFLGDFVRRNGLGDCTLVPAGLADRDALLKLHLLPGRDADSAATVVQSLRPQETFETQWVPCFRFDALRPTLAVDHIALVKIDVEGAELEVLRGMRQDIEQTKPFILCEVLLADAHVDESAYRARTVALRDLVHAIGFAIWHIEKAPDGAVSRLARIETFPFKRWTHQTAEECDYLFVPTSGEAEMTNLGFNLTQ